MVKKRKKTPKQQPNESDVYVKITPSDAVSAKKDMLKVVASIINLQMLSNKIRDSGKKEVRLRNSAKREIKIMNTMINRITTDLPKIKTPKEVADAPLLEKGLTVRASKKDGRKSSLNQELMDIKRRLAKLS